MNPSWNNNKPITAFLLSSEEREVRKEICARCPNLNLTMNICKLCGCFMPVKTWVRSSKCPIQKW